MKIKTVLSSKGGPKAKRIPLEQIQIPDLWHIAMNQSHEEDKTMILDCWHLCHDLLNTLKRHK